MAPPQWAFNVENFNPSPDDELVCSVCHRVFCEPVECPCLHVYCRGCIVKWLTLHRNCPICRSRLSENQLRPVVPIINNMIMKMTLHCKNSEQGCEDTFTVESCESHMKACPFELEECTNGCGNSVFRKDMPKHKAQDCPFRSVECNSCHLEIADTNVDHDCITELKKIIAKKEELNKELQNKVTKLEAMIKDMQQKNNASAVNNDTRHVSGSGFDSDFEIDIGANDDVQLSPLMGYSSSSESDGRFDWSSGFDTSSNDDGVSIASNSSRNSVAWGDGSDDFNLTFSSETDDAQQDNNELSIEEISAADSPVNNNNNNNEELPIPLPSLPPPPSDDIVHSSPESNNSQRSNSRKRRHDATSSPVTVGSGLSDDAGDGTEASVASDTRATFGPLDSTFDSDYGDPLPSTSSGVAQSKRKQKSNANGKKSRKITKMGETSAPENAPLSQKPFEHTLFLLEQYNTDSGTDWLPTSCESSSTETTASTESEAESDSSYEVKIPVSTFSLLERYSAKNDENDDDDDDDDPDWTP